MEELEANAEEQHLDAYIEERTHKTCRVEDVAGDAAAVASEPMQTAEKSMNSFVSRKTDVFDTQTMQGSRRSQW